MQIEITPEYLASQGLSLTFPERFWSKVQTIPTPDGCWPWIAYRDRDGYGKIWRTGKIRDGKIYSHRASWLLHWGPLPEGELRVLHNCKGGGNGWCVNPNHLYAGTDLQNAMDKINNGRHRTDAAPKGEQSGMAKLTTKNILEIREKLAASYSLAELGRLYGVSSHTIYAVKLGLTWKHV